MNIKLLTEHHLGFVSLKGGYTGSSESIHIKIPHYWKLHVTAQLYFLLWRLFLSYFVDPGEMLRNAVVHQGLHCTHFGVTSIKVGRFFFQTKPLTESAYGGPHSGSANICGHGQ